MEVELNRLKRLLVRPQKKAQILQVEAEAGIRENQLLRPSGVRFPVEDNHIVVHAAHTDEIVTLLIVLVANNLRSHNNVRGRHLSYTCWVGAGAAQFFPRRRRRRQITSSFFATIGVLMLFKSSSCAPLRKSKAH
jgi:hypothetical protein